jgi:ketosteroid isomerase-like protein
MHRCLSVFALLFSFIFLLLTDDASAQSHQPSTASRALFEEIAAADSTLFSAFNARDLDKLRTMFTRDLEFYHDQTGLSSYEENMKAFEDLFGRDDGLRRDLVPGSLEVYPVRDYGAIEIGKHTFCHEEDGKEDCGTFPFVMVWRKEGSSWKVSRVISYGH